MAIKTTEIEKLIKLKVYIEQVKNACQRLEKNAGFCSKDINGALDVFNDSNSLRDDKKAGLSSVKSNLKMFINNDFKNAFDDLKSIEKLLKKALTND
ncbi:MAG: hypothetical protein IPM51_12110 [Sphingobacteriaceae bacterium]|nr:hypothetical protein [Sphingobacteriaceae bacterium]